MTEFSKPGMPLRGLLIMAVLGLGASAALGHRITGTDLDNYMKRSGNNSRNGRQKPRRTGTTEIHISGLRRRIAQKMAASHTHIPHFSYIEEVDITELVALRQHLNERRTGQQPRLTYLPFVMLALARALDAAAEGLNPDLPWVLVTHQPPRETIADRVHGGAHVGSRAVRAFIERHRPAVCFTGHIHEGRGVDSIGPTKVVNPGPARGGYALAELGGAVTLVEIKSAPGTG